MFAPEIVIREATPADMHACRRLLPHAFTAHTAPEALVAVYEEKADAFLAGACAVSWCNAPKPELEPSGFPIMVHVVPSMRRRGIGRKLIEGAAIWCRPETTRLRSWLPVPAGSEAAAFLERTGFTCHHHTLHFETGLAPFHDIVDGLRMRLQRSGRIAPDLHVAPLRDAAPWEVADLVAPEFAAPHAAILQRLSPADPNAFDLDRSVALFAGTVLAGVLIFTWNQGAVAIEVIVVAASFRGGAANLLLLEAATRNAIEGGATDFRFFCDERTRDTIGLARRAGAAPRRIEAEYRRALG